MYKLTESFSWKGDFWLESNPDRRISGVVKYTPEDGPQLELTELFDGDPDAIWPVYDSVHGRMGMSDFLLVNASLLRYLSENATYSGTFVADYLLIGTSPRLNSTVQSTYFTLDNLSFFLQDKPFAYREEYETDGRRVASLRFQQPPSRTYH